MHWLDNEPRSQAILDFWEAYDQIEPVRIGESGMLSTLGEEIRVGNFYASASIGGKLPLKNATEFLPPNNLLRKKTPKTKTMARASTNTDEAFKQLEALASKRGFQV